jgi:ribosomal protein L31
MKSGTHPDYHMITVQIARFNKRFGGLTLGKK